jgi:hypothetical protein
MKRRTAVILSSLLLFGGTNFFQSSTVQAAPVEGSVLDRFHKVNIMVNEQELKDDNLPNFLIGNRAAVPLKSFTQLIGAFTQMDFGKIQVIKPNVNMIVSTSIQKMSNNSISVLPFSSVTKGKKLSPMVYYVIDNVPSSDKLSYKIIVRAPDHKEVVSTSTNHEREGNAWVGIEPLGEILFNQSGNYTVQFLMKVNQSDEYIKIGQTIIRSN